MCSIAWQDWTDPLPLAWTLTFFWVTDVNDQIFYRYRGPPLTWKSLTRSPTSAVLAYVRASRGPPTNANFTYRVFFLKSQNPCNAGTLCTHTLTRREYSREKILRRFFYYNDKSQNSKRYPLANVKSFCHLMWKIFCHSGGAKSIKTNLETCRLHTSQSINYFGLWVLNASSSLKPLLYLSLHCVSSAWLYTVVCILVWMKSFLRFWRNHPYCRNKWYLIWTGCLFS